MSAENSLRRFRDVLGGRVYRRGDRLFVWRPDLSAMGTVAMTRPFPDESPGPMPDWAWEIWRDAEALLLGAPEGPMSVRELKRWTPVWLHPAFAKSSRAISAASKNGLVKLAWANGLTRLVVKI